MICRSRRSLASLSGIGLCCRRPARLFLGRFPLPFGLGRTGKALAHFLHGATHTPLKLGKHEESSEEGFTNGGKDARDLRISEGKWHQKSSDRIRWRCEK